MAHARKVLPLVYSCSGCSSAAQLANHLALQLDRRSVAEMSCIAGVGGDVPSLLKVAKSGRPILVIDGCPLECAKKSLERHGVIPNEHVQLAEQGVRKRFHADFDPEQAAQILARLTTVIVERLSAPAPAVPAVGPDAAPANLG
jgi:uncharacterized metal-binding protein